MALYVLLLAIPNPFWIPSLLVCLAGALKYAERTFALYRACFDNMKESKPKLFITELQELRSIPWDNSNIREVNAVAYGYRLYNKFLPLIAGRLIGIVSYERLSFFMSHLEPQNVFKIMDVELNFMYDELFTKMGMLHASGCFGQFLRVTCTALIAAAFGIFTFHKKKQPEIHTFDVGVTYTLLIGAFVLDVVALFKLIFSDWTIAAVKNCEALSGMMHEIQKKIFVGPRWCEIIY